MSAVTTLTVWGLLLSAPEPRELRAEPLGPSERVTIDGRLDEPAWARAEVSAGFVERIPFPGSEPPVDTEVRVLVDHGALYVGVVCHIVPGQVPRALELQRDSFGIFSDEALSLKLDIRHDVRTTVGFVTNPSGAQLDYVAVEGGSEFRREFDAIWRVETTVLEDRWVAEFELPAVALGLPDQPVDLHRVVGINVTRDHNARLATYDWSPMPAEFGAVSALFYGDLLGTDPIGSGRPISLIPYILGAYDTQDGWQGKVGGDVRLRVGEDIWTELTILTDFAQVDLDDPVVNLNRFALFFPERRPFFLSGLEFFEFGAGGEAQLYFSRRIGLNEDGETIELLGGAKAYGTVGSLRFGALGALTADSADEPGRTFSVLRLRQNFGENAHFGAIGTLRTNFSGLTEGQDAEEQISVGVDGAVRAFERRLELSGFAASTLQPRGDAPEGYAGQVSLRYTGYHLQPEVSLLAVSEDFEPAVGFVRRGDRLEPRARLAWTTRTNALGLQEVIVGSETSLTSGLRDGRVQTQRAQADVDVQFRSGLNIYVQAAAVGEVLSEGTTIAGFDVEAGRYEGAYIEGFVGSPGGRNPSARLTLTHNTAFFGGRVSTAGGSVDWRFGKHLLAVAGADYAYIDFDARGDSHALTPFGRLTWTPDTLLQLDLIGQANTVEEEGAGLVRLRWRYLPGSDFFLVYREGVEKIDERFRSRRSLTAKLGFRYDALL